MKQVLGIRVTRSGGLTGESSHIVWAGFTEAERTSHKQFIRDKCYSPKWDGELTLEHVEAPMLVDGPGVYKLDDGRLVDIDVVRHREAHGNFLYRNKAGKLKRKSGANSLFIGYVTGDGSGISAGQHIISKVPAAELH